MTDLTDQTKQAFASAADWSKQLVTLSTGIVTLTVAFADKLFSNPSTAEKTLLWASWVAYLIAILAGVMVLGSLTGALAASGVPDQTQINNGAIKLFARTQLATFAAGVALIVAFGFAALN